MLGIQYTLLIPNISIFNGILRDFILPNLSTELTRKLCLTIVMYYILVSFKYWCIHFLKMARLRRDT